MIEIELDKILQGNTGRMHLSMQTTLQSTGFMALFGPSGAGKTTILRMLAGLMKPDAGKIVVDGEIWYDSTRGINLSPQQRSIGLVFQDYALFPNLTVRQNIAYALTRPDNTWIDELLELTELTASQAQRPSTLSGGQQQRVALARAIARKPALLLLDEPLSALDIDLRTQLQEQLKQLQRRLGFATILISHDMGEVFKLAQQVLRIEQGKIVQSGKPADVFLRQRHAGKLHIHAQVLEIRHEEVVYVLSLLVGNDIVDVIAAANEITGISPGDFITLSAKAFSSLIL